MNMAHIVDESPGPGRWQGSSHFVAGISRHLWELFVPAWDIGIRRGFARYGILIDHFEAARVRGRFYRRRALVMGATELEKRYKAAEQAVSIKLWRADSACWSEIRDKFVSRLLNVARRDPTRMTPESLREHIAEAREIFQHGVIQHFAQQPASMVPVGDWVLRTCEWTGASPAEVLALLQRRSRDSADVDAALDNIIEAIPCRGLQPHASVEQLRKISVQAAMSLDAYLDRYGDRVVTGFDVTDATLRELPQLTCAIISHRSQVGANDTTSSPAYEDAEARLRDRVPADKQKEFEEGIVEARDAYGLHDEDVRILYLWPLGVIRRALLAAARLMVDRGAILRVDDIFETTPMEFDSLLLGGAAPTAEELRGRTEEGNVWKHAELPTAWGEPEQFLVGEQAPEACVRVNRAIGFYLSQVEGMSVSADRPWSTFVYGFPASSGCYEGPARVVRDPPDLAKLHQGDVLVARTTSPAYSLMLSMVGAVVTDRGGTLCHAAIIAREFGVPAVVGAEHATERIPDGAMVLVDGSRGFVAVRAG
jgi:phosphohistidine swiveling domain-containing protein